MEGHAARPFTMLTVDDHEELHVLYRKVFADGDVDVVGHASNGNEAVEAAGRLEPDIVMMDLSMPERDGLEAIVDIRQARPATRVLVVSGFGKDRLGDIAAELGASGYVEKGARAQEIRDAVAEALARDPPPVGSVSQAMLERIHELI